MQDKKELILDRCRDLIYETAFNMPYNQVKRIYTNYQIKQKLDKFLTELIERGEFFYGDNFTDDLVNEKNDKSQKWLINDIMYGNGVDVYSPEKKPADRFEPAKKPVQNIKKATNTEVPSYEVLLEELKKCGWPDKAANEFILSISKDENTRKKATEALNKLSEAKEEDQSKETKEEESQVTEPIKAQTKEENQNEETKEEESQIAEPLPKPIKVQTEEPKPTFLKKFRDKLKDPKFRRNIIIGGIVIAVGVVAVALNPEVQQFLGDLVNNASNVFTGDEVTNVVDANNLIDVFDEVNDVVDTNNLTAVSSAVDVSSFDLSDIDMEGFTVYDSADEAVNQINAESANQFFSSNIQGFYDTNTREMLNISPEDMQNADYIKELLSSNENIAAVFGNGDINTLNDVSGFANGEDVIDLIDRAIDIQNTQNFANGEDVIDLIEQGRSR